MASLQMLMFRSAELGYFDLTGIRRIENYGDIRMDCWVNAIPAWGTNVDGLCRLQSMVFSQRNY